MKEEFERAYRDELDHVRLTQEGKQALAERLGQRAAPSRRSPLGRAAAAAVAACLLAAAVMFGAVNAPAVVASATQRQLPIYCVQRDQKMVSISFDAAWGNVILRQEG